MTTINRETKTITQPSISRKWLYMSLAAAALTLSACADKGAATTEEDPSVDAQSTVEQQATGVASADTSNEPMSNEPMVNDDIGIATADEGVAIDDSEVLDGSEQEEHVSTY
ncbi:hypothetical protein [Psychrobacter sp. LV10R520-6]|uniref:hypothetical protein n=1 Tax=Psychrobacter sp. LV10R520-6 TaxID=1415574 RepID=UPI0024C94A68|nr:hypothetical protein [Psychrobacter sp. LV10R520-6]SNT71452.1 hypothetical protein SAMN04488491_2693 [Psychrobacter sp. LV10R520-6]